MPQIKRETNKFIVVKIFESTKIHRTIKSVTSSLHVINFMAFQIVFDTEFLSYNVCFNANITVLFADYSDQERKKCDFPEEEINYIGIMLIMAALFLRLIKRQGLKNN